MKKIIALLVLVSGSAFGFTKKEAFPEGAEISTNKMGQVVLKEEYDYVQESTAIKTNETLSVKDKLAAVKKLKMRKTTKGSGKGGKDTVEEVDAPVVMQWNQVANILSRPEVSTNEIPDIEEALGNTLGIKQRGDLLGKLARLKLESGEFTASQHRAFLMENKDKLSTQAARRALMIKGGGWNKDQALRGELFSSALLIQPLNTDRQAAVALKMLAPLFAKNQTVFDSASEEYAFLRKFAKKIPLDMSLDRDKNPNMNALQSKVLTYMEVKRILAGE